MTAARTVDAVLFDLDGTLVDSLPTIAETMAVVFGAHGHPITEAELLRLIGPPIEVLALSLGASAAQAARINADYLRLYHHGSIQRTPPYAGAAALLDRLEAAGIALGVVTNKIEEGGRLMLAVQGWSERFRVVVGRETAAAAKPHPEAAWHALRALGVAPERAAIVGDTEFDMGCGRAAGLRYVIGVIGARDEAQLRAEGATHVVPALAGVAPLLLGAGVAP